MIMPLATRRDKVTQVRWGLDDFRRRFGREPEGLWLPETAVDDESLEVLAEDGVKLHRSWRRTRPAARAGAPEGARTGEWAEGGSTRAAPTAGGARAGHAGDLLLRRPDLPRDRLRGPARVGRHLRGPARAGVLRRSARGRSSSTAPPTASPTATTSRSATWRSPPRVQQIEAVGRRDADELRRLPGGAPADARGRDPREHVVELRPRGRALAGRLRLPQPRRLAPALARPAAGGPRLAARPDRSPSSRRARRRPARIRGPRGTPTSTSSSTGAPSRLEEFFADPARAPLDAGARVEARRLLELAAQPAPHVHLVRLVLRRDLRHRARAEPPVCGAGAPVPRDLGGAGSRTSSCGGWRPRRATWPSWATAGRSTGA